jgi:cell division septation protein DedD
MSNTSISDKHSLASLATDEIETEWDCKELTLWATVEEPTEAKAHAVDVNPSDDLDSLADAVVEESKGVVLLSDEPLPAGRGNPELRADVESSYPSAAGLIQENHKDMVLWNGHEPTTLSLSTYQQPGDALACESLELESSVPQEPLQMPENLLSFPTRSSSQQFGEKVLVEDEERVIDNNERINDDEERVNDEESVLDLSDLFTSPVQESLPEPRAVESPEHEQEAAEVLTDVFPGETLADMEPVLTTIAAEESHPAEELRMPDSNLTPEISLNAVEAQSPDVQVARLSSFWLFAAILLFVGLTVFSIMRFAPAQSSPENSAWITPPQPVRPVSNTPPNTGTGAEQTSDAQPALPGPGAAAPSQAANGAKSNASLSPAEIEETKAPLAAPADNKPAPASDTSQAGGFTTQVSSSQNVADSNRRAEDLKAAGFQARVVKVDLPKRGSWYRVQVGFFSSRKEAEGFAAQMKSKGAATDVIVTPTEAQ